MPRRGESIYKRKDGRWEARYIHHYENGKAKYRFLYGATYAQVKAKRQQELSAQPPLRTAAPAAVSFGALSAQWLTHVRPAVKESTYTRYHRTVHRYLNARLGDAPLGALDAAQLRRLSFALAQGGGVHGKPLSAKTVADMMCVLRSILRYGEQLGYPCPHIDRLAISPRRGRTAMILTEQDRRRAEQLLWEADDPFSLGVLLTLYTGVRIGELCGLCWGDIDLHAGIATIRRTVERIADLDPTTPSRTKLVISEPKTAHSVRLIPIPTRLRDHMLAARRPAECYLLTGTAQVREPQWCYQRYKAFMRRHGMGQYTFHALRHTFATRCVACGFDAKSLSEILGHANVSTTMAIYVHPTMEQKREQMERLLAGSTT